MSSTGRFSEPGDSGLFVFNNIREVAGLLYGELTGNIMLGETDSEADSRGIPPLHGEYRGCENSSPRWIRTCKLNGRGSQVDKEALWDRTIPHHEHLILN